MVGSTRCDPKSSALDCVSEIPRPSASCAHRCVVSPSPRRATSGPAVPGPARRRAAPWPACRRRAAAAARRAGVEQRVAVGTVVEHGGAVVADGAPGLDQEMGPLRVVRVGAEAGRLGHRGAGQGQVALRRGRHGPQVVAPGPGAQGRYQDAALVAKSSGAKWPPPSSWRPRPNSPR